MTTNEEHTKLELGEPEVDAPVQTDGATRPNWTVMDIGAIVVALAGEAYTFLPWGVYDTRLEELDIALMVTPVFIFVAAILSYVGTVLVKKTNGTRSGWTASIARTVIWGAILSLIPIFIRFISVLIGG